MDLGRRVVVIGGGFVAFDAARTALRLGREEDADRLEALAGEADARMKEALDSARAALRGGAAEVTIVSLESFDEMPVLRTTQGHEEFEEAKKRRRRLPARAAARSASSASGRLEAVELRACRLGLRRERPLRPALRRRRTSSRSRPTPASSRSARSRTSRSSSPSDGVALTPGGTIRVDPATLATSAPGIFAGGDVAFGPRNLIEAVANGKRAARSIHEYLARGARAARGARSRSRRSRPRATG